MDDATIAETLGRTELDLLLEELMTFVRRYVVLGQTQSVTVALWAAHTYVFDVFEATPFLGVTSPEKECGKTRLFEVLEFVVREPWRVVMPSEAVVFRKIDKTRPTLLLDETDAIFKDEKREALRALLNGGNRSGSFVPRCVGPSQQLVDFAIFCPKALAGIGELPDTITSRSIVVRMARQRKDERVARLRVRDTRTESQPLREQLATWAQKQETLTALETARPLVPDALGDRAAESWEPLLAIAEMASGEWPERARLAALELSASRVSDAEEYGVRLLADVRDVFDRESVDRITSVRLAEKLCEIEESPWGDIRGRQLDARGLARRLKPYEVRPRPVRFDDSVAKGYYREQFGDAFARYLPSVTVTELQTASLGEKQLDLDGYNADSVTDEKPLFSASLLACNSVTAKNASYGDGDGDSSRSGVPRSSEKSDPLPVPGDPGFALWIYERFRAGVITETEFDDELRLSMALYAR